MHSPNPRNSNWLDRLRSSKGFPISTNLDSLDHFLTPNPNPNPSPIQPPPSKPPNSKNDHRHESLFHVLSDLFVMPNPSSTSNPTPLKKSARKQPNPRSHNGASSQSSANDNNEGKKRKRKRKARGNKIGGGGSDELLGFSRTEVTVIDTSLSPEWKAARVAYRKGNVWKVKERKGVRVRRRKKKKSKVGVVEKLGGEKKRERSEGERRKVQLASLSKIVDTKAQRPSAQRKECALTHKGDDTIEKGKQILVPGRRPKFSRSPRIPAAKNYSVLRLKVICNGATTGTNTLQGKMKGVQEIL